MLCQFIFSGGYHYRVLIWGIVEILQSCCAAVYLIFACLKIYLIRVQKSKLLGKPKHFDSWIPNLTIHLCVQRNGYVYPRYHALFSFPSSLQYYVVVVHDAAVQ